MNDAEQIAAAMAAADRNAGPQAACDNAYRGGGLTRLTRDWLPAHRSGDGAIHETWDLLTSRVRDQARNEPSIVAARRVLVNHVVGAGLQTNAAVTVPDESGVPELLEKFNQRADALFDEWAETETDSEGKLSFGAMQRLALGDAADAGEVLLLEQADADPNRLLPLCYQLVEAEQLDLTKDQPAAPGVNEIRRGVELDTRGRAVAYHLYGIHPQDPFGNFDGTSVRVPADRVIHYFEPARPSQTRGVTWWAPMMLPAKDRDWLIGNVLTAAAVQAIFTAVIKTKTPGAGGLGFGELGETSSTDAGGNSIFKLGKGTVAEILPDEEIESVQSSQPAQQLPQFYKDVLLNEHSMASGISSLRLNRDYSRTNFSSARAAHNDDHRTFAPLSNSFGCRVVKRIRRRWTEMAAAMGLFEELLRPREFRANPRRWLAAELILPGRLLTDPVKEWVGAVMAVAAGMSTLKDEIASTSGRDWRAVLRQRAREIQLAERLGVPIDLSNSRDLANTMAAADEPVAGEAA